MQTLLKNALYPPLISEPPAGNLSLSVTIPCHDEPELLRTLASLQGCECPEDTACEVIVVINGPENAAGDLKKRNEATFREAQKWAEQFGTPQLSFHIFLFPDLPPKHAGVGLARKIAMDEAAGRFFQLGKPKGIIACLDADSRVERNYLKTLIDYFDRRPNCPAASIYFEHPLEGDEFDRTVYEAIIRYELHLRYYVHALRAAGLPTAVQTVGSSMAVRADAYSAQGGMNRRQAGEDFYFLHKFTPLGHFGEIVDTKVIPSPRPSHRVPFGTGKTVGEMLGGAAFTTYSPWIFRDLGCFLKKTEELYDAAGRSSSLSVFLEKMPNPVKNFLTEENFTATIEEIHRNTADIDSFRKRFFRRFDAFWAMKFTHYARDRFYPNIPVETAAHDLLFGEGEPLSGKELLLKYRDLDRGA